MTAIVPVSQVTPAFIADLNANFAAIATADMSSATVTSAGSTAARMLAARFADVIDVKDFGAVGDGVTDDTAAIQRAAAACQVAGGIVFLPPTGNAYKTTDTIALGNGVKLVGSGTLVFPGATATNAQWTAQGSWINPTHASNPAVKLQGNGSACFGLNFIHVQPTPSNTPSTAWAPNTYGYCVEVNGTMCHVENVRVVNASHGINWNYTTGSGGGTNCWMRNIRVSAYVVRTKTANVNDVMHWSDIHCGNLWYSSNSNVVDYIRANTIGWDCGYTDNIMVDGLEFFEDAIGIKLTDGTVLSTTHSLYNATLTNVQFNLPQVCMKVATTTTTVRAKMANVLSQTGNAFGRTWSDTAFQLGSDNVKINMADLSVVDAGGAIMTLGNGSGSRVSVGLLTVENYSSVSGGQTAFTVGAGGILSVAGFGIFNKTAGSGPRYGGSGTFRFEKYVQLYSTIGQFPSTTLSGTWQDVSASVGINPNANGFTQARLSGSINVNTPIALETFQVRFSGQATVTQVGISGATTGFKAVDTGWIDLADNNTTDLGRLQAQTAGGGAVVLAQAELKLAYR